MAFCSTLSLSLIGTKGGQEEYKEVPVHQKRTIRLNLPRLEALSVVHDAIQSLRLRSIQEIDGMLTAKTRMTVWSFGEIITAQVEIVDGMSLLHLESRSSLSTTKVDYGVNQYNLDQILTVLKPHQVKTHNSAERKAAIRNNQQLV